MVKDGVYKVGVICAGEFAKACARRRPQLRRAAMTVTSPVATDTVLSMQGVSKRFGAVQALKDIELDVCAGEVVALVGDNGAGKSTLVKTIAGVYSPDEGDMTFDGRPVRVASPPRPSTSASPPSSRTSPCATTSTSSATSSSAGS